MTNTRTTHTIDATDRILGRVATEIATLLRGKHKPSFQPHLDEGDIVVVQNASKLRVSGNKLSQKIYYRHTGHPGGIRTESMKDLMQDNPARLLRSTVRLMLPDNKLRSAMLKRLIIE